MVAQPAEAHRRRSGIFRLDHPRNEPEPVRGGKREHCRKKCELAQKNLPVQSREQTGDRSDQEPAVDETRFSTGAASSGSSPWKVANWQTTGQQIAFAVISIGGSSAAIAVMLRTPTASIRRRSVRLRPASLSWRDRRTSRHGGIEHAHRTAGWRRLMAAQLRCPLCPHKTDIVS
jgi:hypothetical protein